MKSLPESETPAKQGARYSRWLLLGTLALLVGCAYVLDAPGMWMRSLAHRALRAHDARQALLWTERSLSYSANDRQAHLLAARAHLQLNLNAAAQADLARASNQVAAQPDAELLAHQEMISAQMGDLQAAERLLQWDLDYALPNEAYEAILRCTLQHGEFDLARAILNQLDQLQVEPALVAYQRGRIHEVAEEFQQAAADYQAALALRPAMLRAAFRAGTCFYELRQFQAAAEMFSRAARGHYQQVANIELASSLWEDNQFQAAEQAIAVAIDSDPLQLQADYLELEQYVDEDRAALVAARIDDAQGNSQRAIENLRRVLAFNHRSFEARGLLIKNLQATNQRDEAEQLAELQREMIANRERCRSLVLELEASPHDIEKRCELAELYWYTESVAQRGLRSTKFSSWTPIVSEHSRFSPRSIHKTDPEKAIVHELKPQFQSEVTRFLLVICLAWVLVAVPGCNSSDSDSRLAHSKPGRSRPLPTEAVMPSFDVVHVAELSQAEFSNGFEANLNSMLEIVGGGLGCVDYDRDGWVDLFFPRGGRIDVENQLVEGVPSSLMRGRGDFGFSTVTSAARIDTSMIYSHGVAAADVDHDGFSDLLVYGYGGVRLLQNQGDGTFEDVTGPAQLEFPYWVTAAAWMDIDNDQHLDLYLGSYVDWSPEKNIDLCDQERSRRCVFACRLCGYPTQVLPQRCWRRIFNRPTCFPL